MKKPTKIEDGGFHAFLKRSTDAELVAIEQEQLAKGLPAYAALAWREREDRRNKGVME